jgi:hypothetical protein
MGSRYTHPLEEQAPIDAAALDEWLTARETNTLVQFPVVARSVAQ